MTWKFTSIIFWKEQDLGAKEANKRRPEGPDEWAHAAQVPGRVGPLHFGPRGSVVVDLSSTDSVLTYKCL